MSMPGSLLASALLALLCLLPAAVASSSELAGQHLDRRHHLHRSSGGVSEPSAAPISAAVLNPFPWCFEVLFGVTYSLQHVVQVVDLYVDHLDRAFVDSGADDFLRGFHSRQVRSYRSFFEGSVASYQLVVWLDFNGWESVDRRREGPRDLLDLGYSGKIWIFSHEPTLSLWPLICNCEDGKKWTEDPDYISKSSKIYNHSQVEWFCIAPHIASSLQDLLDSIGYIKQVQWILPVFPWSNTSWPDTPWFDFKDKKGFAIQGNLGGHRRNYTGLLDDVAGDPVLISNSRFELDLFSWNQLDPALVPASLSSKLVHKPRRFPEFYSEIHDTLGLLLLFPGDRYFKVASSSSIATAVSTGVPMVVDPKFLDVYTFFPREAVVVANASSHAEALHHMLNMTAAKWGELANTMTLVRESAFLRNVQIFNKTLGGPMVQKPSPNRRLHR